ncbi:MAG TPA: glycoside hydrolase family 15 protein, partial [bacterium]|nr:glycoside hydrolase family 15 protein [bacterium]
NLAPRDRELQGWPGYRGSHPVRVGNAAGAQHQLDVYGWVIDAAFVLHEAGHRLYPETWRAMADFADLVSRRWTEPDAGLWEVPGPPRHYVHSKLMAWLALNRAIRMSGSYRTTARRRHRWSAALRAIAADVAANGYDEERQTYVRSYGSAELDAAVLILPVLGLEEPRSPRVVGTIEAIQRSLGAGGALLHRYPPGGDHLPGREGAFLACSFWLVQALAMAGRMDEATSLFEDLISLGGGLGLLAEEADPATRGLLGNYPQALTHGALVQSALAIRDAETSEAHRA